VVREKATGRFREGRPEKTVLDEDRFSLADLGISKNESAQAQEFASVAEEAFERMLDESGSGDLSDAALLRRIRAAKAEGSPTKSPPSKRTAKSRKAKAASTATDTNASPTADAPSSTVPGHRAGPISLEAHLDLAAEALARVVADWKRGSLAPLRETARGHKQILEALGRMEKDLDLLLKRLPDAAQILRFRSAEAT
jgi:hypothetical protein